MFQTTFVDKLKNTHFISSNIFCRMCRLWKKCGKTWKSPTGHT